MRIAQNKAMAPATKEVSYMGIDLKLKKDLDKVEAVIAKAEKDDPETRRDYIEKIKKMQTIQAQAEQIKEDAKTEEELDQAITDISRASEKEKFYSRRLYEMDHTPRMNERTYNKSIEIMETAKVRIINEYREKAAALMGELYALHNDYLDQAATINSTLERLDQAANVLQSKYPGKVTHYLNAPDQIKEDPTAWKEYAVRFTPDQATRAATCPEEKERTDSPGAMWDSVLTNAWTAINKGYPRHIF